MMCSRTIRLLVCIALMLGILGAGIVGHFLRKPDRCDPYADVKCVQTFFGVQMVERPHGYDPFARLRWEMLPDLFTTVHTTVTAADGGTELLSGSLRRRTGEPKPASEQSLGVE